MAARRSSTGAGARAAATGSSAGFGCATVDDRWSAGQWARVTKDGPRGGPSEPPDVFFFRRRHSLLRAYVATPVTPYSTCAGRLTKTTTGRGTHCESSRTHASTSAQLTPYRPPPLSGKCLQSARARNRRNGRLSALSAHTKVPYKMYFRSKMVRNARDA